MLLLMIKALLLQPAHLHTPQLQLALAFLVVNRCCQSLLFLHELLRTLQYAQPVKPDCSVGAGHQDSSSWWWTTCESEGYVGSVPAASQQVVGAPDPPLWLQSFSAAGLDACPAFLLLSFCLFSNLVILLKGSVAKMLPSGF